MTDKELKKLSRVDLLEMLVSQSKEIERLQALLDEANAKLDSRVIAISEAGSIANASLQLSGVFTAAEEAASQYLENIKLLSDQQEARCREMEDACAARCEAMRAETEEYCKQEKQNADIYWKSVSAKLQSFYDEHQGLRKLLAKIEDDEAQN